MTEERSRLGTTGGKDEEKESRVTAEDESIAIGEIKIGGDVKGNFEIVRGDKVTNIEEATEAKNQKEFKLNELEELRLALLEKREALRAKADAPSVADKRYHLKPLDLNQSKYLLGRANLLDQLIDGLNLGQTVLLSGRSGLGRTSLLQAGLMPALIRGGDLPVLVPIVAEATLDLSIRRNILARIESTSYLMPRTNLAKFLEHATEVLPEDKRLVILLDGFENISEQGLEGQLKDLETQWRLTQSNGKLRWVFSADEDFIARLSRFRSDDPLEVLPFDRPTATQALGDPEQGGLKLDEADLNHILSELESYRQPVRGASINPADLQVVLWSLAQRGPSQSLSEFYAAKQRVNGFFAEYLASTIEKNFDDEQQPVVWKILTFLYDENRKPVSASRIESKLSADRLNTTELPDLLRDLRKQHVIGTKGQKYVLANVNLEPGIRKRLEQQSLFEEAREKSNRQLENIRASALRGMLAGGIGFGVFRWAVGKPIYNLESVLFLFLLFAPIGGLTGLLLTFVVDVFLAQNRGERPLLRYLVSALTGAVMFGLALAVYVYLAETIEEAILPVVLAGFVGGAWGVVTGAGVAWGLNSVPVNRLKILASAAAGAIVLYLFNLFIPVLNQAPDWRILLGGFVFPLAILVGVLYWKRSAPE